MGVGDGRGNDACGRRRCTTGSLGSMRGQVVRWNASLATGWMSWDYAVFDEILMWPVG
jgi:hypothetical protein